MADTAQDELGYYEKTVEYAFLVQAITRPGFESATPLSGLPERWFGDVCIHHARRWMLVEYKSSFVARATDFDLEKGKWKVSFLQSKPDLSDLAISARGLHYFVYACGAGELEACDYFIDQDLSSPAAVSLAQVYFPATNILDVQTSTSAATDGTTLQAKDDLHSYLVKMIAHRRDDGRMGKESRYVNLTVMGIDASGRFVAALPVGHFLALAPRVTPPINPVQPSIHKRKPTGTKAGRS